MIAANVYVDAIDHAGLPRADALALLQQAASENKSVVLPKNFALITQFSNEDDYAQFASFVGPWKAGQVLRTVGDVPYAATAFRPFWYEPEAHAELFDSDAGFAMVDGYLADVATMFASPWFKRASDADRLTYILSRIKPGPDHAHLFQQFVADALTTLFPEGLRRVQCNPNGNAQARRDVVATNNGTGPFWARILHDYRALWSCSKRRTSPPQNLTTSARSMLISARHTTARLASW